MQTFAERTTIPRADLDRSVEILQGSKDRWSKLPIAQKEELVGRLIEGVYSVADRLVDASLKAKGIPPGSTAVGEEWIGGISFMLRNLRTLRQSLRQIARFGIPQIPPAKIRTRPGGQVVVDVFPGSLFDKLLFPGVRAEVWMQPEVRPDNLNRTLASFYQQGQPDGKVALVLGAGNYSCIGPLDVVYKMFVEGRVCLLKLNPVNDYIGPFIEEAFSPLVLEGYLRFAYGGADVGSYLCQHPGIDEIHITGGAQTHDAIVFGPGEEGADRKRRNQPILKKRITSELGNNTPVILVPGPWSHRDLKFQAENIVTQKANNAGFNCIAAQTLITQKDWTQREAYLNAVRDTLRALPARQAYYPGASSRYARIVSAHPEAETFSPQSDGILPWTLISGLDPQNHDDVCFGQEAFCSITAETPLAASNTADFLSQAVDFCNASLYGTLGATIIVHPQTAAELGPRLDEAIANLHYGTVGVNLWSAASYAYGTTAWGGFPGHTLDNIGSGIGVVHNSFMFDKPQKSVVYGPFRPRLKPPFFVTHKAGAKIGPLLASFEARPRWSLVPRLMWNAL